ncbi:MAG: hypothetical protein JSW38_05395 [Dehalococcoidia bacterium]|nr:MAG: hypothetical protein JSW38_05395 [Dehalococcoidia bacterium]
MVVARSSYLKEAVIRGKVFLCGAILVVLIISLSSLPVLAQGPSFADVESEIDAIQWGMVYHLKEDSTKLLEALRLLIVLEVADKFVERVMIGYSDSGQVTDTIERYLSWPVGLLERAKSQTEDGGFIIDADMDRAVEAEIGREQKLDERGWLSAGDEPWTGDSMAAYVNYTTVDSYIDVVISRINLWMAI